MFYSVDGDLYLNLNLNTYYHLTFWGLEGYRNKQDTVVAYT